MIWVDWNFVAYKVEKWIAEEKGIAMVEAAMLFPPMITLLLGVFDLGNGIVLSQKTITASQVAADLIARNRSMNTGNLTDIIEGAKLAFEPYPLVEFGVDVVSVEFDQYKNPQILWRHTENMPPNDAAVSSVTGLSDQGEGMVIVTVQYTYIPQFAHFFSGNLDFSEVAYTRGRRSATVTWE